MVQLYDQGAYLINGEKLVPEQDEMCIRDSL